MQTLPVNLPTSTTMSVDEFIKIRDCTVQRPTKEHAKVARRKHLNAFHNSHCKVNIANVKGTLYKLDGHTRAYLWSAGELCAPERLSVDIWHFDTIEEMERAYYTYDNKAASETNMEILLGQVKKKGYESQGNSIFRQGALSSIRQIFGSGYDLKTEGLPPRYVTAIEILDEQEYKKGDGRLNAGLISAMVATVMRDGELAIGFWNEFLDEPYDQSIKRKCGIQLLHHIVKTKFKQNGGQKIRGSFEYGLACYEAFLEGRSATRIEPLSFKEFDSKA